MLVKAVKTRPLIPPQDDLLSVISESIFELKEKSIIVVTSKVVSIWESRCIKISEVKNKEDLVRQEADIYIGRNEKSSYGAIMPTLTIKNNILIPTAGIDESNADGYYILWPKDPFASAKKIYEFIKKQYGPKEFGVIISDSHTAPLRTGITGIGISFFGFNPLRDYRNKKDIFGRKLKMSQTNIADSLAAAAVYEMGEGAEQTPIAIIEDAGDIEFTEKDFSPNPLVISPDDDIYAPILKSVNWQSK